MKCEWWEEGSCPPADARHLKLYAASLHDDDITVKQLRSTKWGLEIYSIWEVEFYLQRKKAEPELIAQIVNRLSSLQMLDDAKFADSWITNRRLLKPTSLRRLKLELRQKHVAEDVIEAALSASPGDAQAELRDLIERKRRQSRYQDDQKLMQFLVRQGYSYGDVKAALSS